MPHPKTMLPFRIIISPLLGLFQGTELCSRMESSESIDWKSVGAQYMFEREVVSLLDDPMTPHPGIHSLGEVFQHCGRVDLSE